MEQERLSYTKSELEQRGYKNIGCAMINKSSAFMKAGNRYYPIIAHEEAETETANLEEACSSD